MTNGAQPKGPCAPADFLHARLRTEPMPAPANPARVFAERRTLSDAFADADGDQRRVLRDLLEFNSGTRYGRQYGFDRIRTLDDFRKAVPVQTYTDLQLTTWPISR